MQSGSNGWVSLEYVSPLFVNKSVRTLTFSSVYQPLSGLVGLTTSSSVLLYLPRGPWFANKDDETSNVAIIRSELDSPLVKINYRLNSTHPFPTPLHDILAGYDWALANLLPKRGITRPGRSESVGRIAVCGELVGGGLATALAMTECRAGEPGIMAAAVSNPLVDWVDLGRAAPSVKAKKGGKKSRVVAVDQDDAAVKDLLMLRAQLFKRPQDYFDPFASPMLFFRSAGADVPPPASPPLDDLERLSLLEREEVLKQASHGVARAQDTGTNESTGKAEEAIRTYSRRYPSKSLGLRLPQFSVSTGSLQPFHGQAGELTKHLRQSVARQSKDAQSPASEFGRKVLLDDEIDDQEVDADTLKARQLQDLEARERVRLEVHDGPGLWDASPAGRERMAGVAEWLREVMR